MKITLKFSLILIVPITINLISTPSVSSETKLYVCSSWEKISYNRVRVESPESELESPFILKVLSADEGIVEFPPGFRIRMTEDRPNLITARRAVRQSHRDSMPQRSIYVENRPNYQSVFQFVEYRHEDMIAIRELRDLDEDYGTLCKRND